MAGLAIDSLTRRFGPVTALDGVSLSVGDGDALAVLGPSGSGKTTLLRLVAGLETPDSGRILLDGRDLRDTPPHLRRCALLSQEATLYPHLSVDGNLRFGLSRPSPRLPGIVSFLGLQPLLQRRPHELSGGQRQRVALARALAREARLVLLDEPFGHLDSVARWELLAELPLLRRRFPFTMILVTHEQADALALAGRAALLANGRLLQQGPPSELHDRPASVEAARLLGWPPVNLLPGRVDEDGSAFGACRLPPLLSGWKRFADRPALLGLRPSSLRLAAQAGAGEGSLPVGVEGRVPSLPHPWLLAKNGEERIVLSPGEGGLAVFPAAEAHLFDAVTGEALAHGAD
ncbi:MAG: ABC transporter ATP-binding protein [Gemmataceae bacterium]|nr:ABC transporter ATP-binding protein [Gemmataceae bacterium]